MIPYFDDIEIKVIEMAKKFMPKKTLDKLCQDMRDASNRHSVWDGVGVDEVKSGSIYVGVNAARAKAAAARIAKNHAVKAARRANAYASRNKQDVNAHARVNKAAEAVKIATDAYDEAKAQVKASLIATKVTKCSDRKVARAHLIAERRKNAEAINNAFIDKLNNSVDESLRKERDSDAKLAAKAARRAAAKEFVVQEPVVEPVEVQVVQEPIQEIKQEAIVEVQFKEVVPNAASTHVYVIRMTCEGMEGMDNIHKIGITNDIDKRLATLQTANPFDLRVVKCVPVKNPRAIEKALHLTFSAQRTRSGGEWFNVPSEDILVELDKLTNI